MTATTPTTPWIAYNRPNPRARLRLFCFPYAGGGASIYRTWASEVPPEVDVYPIQLPGRENRLRERPHTQLAPLLDQLLPALLPYLNTPFAFFGHSMGVIICFELARALRRLHGLTPAWLFLSGHRAPGVPDRSPHIHDLPDGEFVQELRRFNGTPEAVLQNAELMQLMLPVLRSDFTLVETTNFGTDEPLTCPISAFGGLEDAEATREDMAPWRDHTRGSFTLRMFPGGHFFIHEARQQVLQVLSQDLQQLLRSIPL
jgi:medium-chain acyl-[acyl-carrier-protein] hydrolase